MSDTPSRLGPLSSAVSLATAAIKLISIWTDRRAARQNIEMIFSAHILDPKTGRIRKKHMDFVVAQLRFVATELNTHGPNTVYHVEVSRTDLPGTDRSQRHNFIYACTGRTFHHR